MRYTHGLALVFALFAAKRCAGAEAPKPLPVTVYYSKEDPHWLETEKKLDAVIKKYGKQIAFKKVSMDDPKGYAALAEVEKRLKIEEPGEITVVMGHFALTSKDGRRDVERRLAWTLAILFGAGTNKGRRPAPAHAFARRVFRAPSATLAKDRARDGAVFYSVRTNRNKKILGWVVDVFQPIHCPVCGDAQFLAAVAAPGKGKDEAPRIVEVEPVRKLELYGAPMPRERARKFLEQFKGWTPKSSVKVDAISGATKTSRAYGRGMRLVLSGLAKRKTRK